MHTMKNIYFIRHGETEGNAKSIWQTPDTPLSEVGIRQAHAVALRCAKIPHDVIIHSSYQRAYQTAEIIASATHKPLRETTLLFERLRPSIVRGVAKDDPHARAVMHQVEGAFYIQGKENRIHDEEGFYELRERAHSILAEIIAFPERHIIAVTHRDILKYIVGVILFHDAFTPEIHRVFASHITHANTGITKCIFTKENGWNLHTWSDEAHLG